MSNFLEEDIGVCCSLPIMDKIISGDTFLITGATGMIGRYLVHVLIKYRKDSDKKINIVIVVRSLDKAQKIFGEYLKQNLLTVILSDVIDDFSYDDNIDYLIHAASLTDVGDFSEKPVEVYEANTIGTHKLLKLAMKKKVKKFLFISSANVYGKVIESELKEEKAGQLDFSDYRNSYAESKRTGELMCNAFRKEYKLPIVIARPFHMYGPGMNLQVSTMIVDFFKKVMNKENIILKSSGNRKRNFCYLRDSVIALLSFLLIEGVEGTYNVGNFTESKSVEEFARQLIHVTGSNIKIDYIIDEGICNPSNEYDIVPDLCKLQKIWPKTIQQVSLEDGIMRFIIEQTNCKGDNT